MLYIVLHFLHLLLYIYYLLISSRSSINRINFRIQKLVGSNKSSHQKMHEYYLKK